MQGIAGPLPPPHSLMGPATSREESSSEPPACLACSLSHSAASVRQRQPPSQQAEPCGAGQSQHASSLAGVSAGVSFSGSGSLGFAAPSSPSSSSSLGGFVHLSSGSGATNRSVRSISSGKHECNTHAAVCVRRDLCAWPITLEKGVGARVCPRTGQWRAHSRWICTNDRLATSQTTGAANSRRSVLRLSAKTMYREHVGVALEALRRGGGGGGGGGEGGRRSQSGGANAANFGREGGTEGQLARVFGVEGELVLGAQRRRSPDACLRAAVARWLTRCARMRASHRKSHRPPRVAAWWGEGG